MLLLGLPHSLRGEVLALGKRCGFAYVAVDLAGFRSGSSNEVLLPLGRRAADRATP